MIPDTKYFSIHNLQALKQKQFSVVLANIENTKEKINKAIEMYPPENWYIEFHDIKISTQITV